jgi:predicted O-methyltransferase YrrM
MLLLPYLKHLLFAKGPHGVHSPFVFKLITDVLKQRRPAVWNPIEGARRKLLANDTVYVVKDFGAGSKGLQTTRTYSRSVASSAMPKKKGEALHLLVEHLQPSGLLEIGTHFGIGTLYLSEPLHSTKKIITLEGDPTHAAEARSLFHSFQKNNIEVVEGNFNDTLPTTLNTFPEMELVYVDGNHTEEATLRYFEILLQHKNITCIVFDDIYWSKGMMRAWKKICADSRIKLSLDFYWFGVIFLNGRMRKEHFDLYLPR